MKTQEITVTLDENTVALAQQILARTRMLDASLTEVAATLQRADADDHMLVVTLRNKYQLPHRIAEVATAYADLADSLGDFFKTLNIQEPT